jgi:energy-converting hydrogenase Eha subunit A
VVDVSRLRRPIALTAVCALAVAACLGSPALAKPRPKPITKTFQVSAFPPDPTYGLGVTQGTCNQVVPGSHVDTPLKAPFAGTITVDLTAFTGDWDLALLDAAGSIVAKSSQEITDPVDRPEHLSHPMAAGTAYTVRACNFLGGKTATVTYTLKPK